MLAIAPGLPCAPCLMGFLESCSPSTRSDLLPVLCAIWQVKAGVYEFHSPFWDHVSEVRTPPLLNPFELSPYPHL